MKKVLKFIVFGFIALAVLGALLGGNENEKDAKGVTQQPNVESTSTQESKVEAKNKHLVASGMYKIGTDLPAGEYMLIADSMAYYEVTKDSSGTLESIIINDNFFINRYITVKEGDYIKLQSCKLYELEKVPDLDQKEMYKVGVDLEPGEYKVAAEGQGYLEVSNNSRGGLDSIISNDNFEGEKYITVKDGQYLKLMSAALK